MLPERTRDRHAWSSARTTRRRSSCSATTSPPTASRSLPAPSASDALRLCQLQPARPAGPRPRAARRRRARRAARDPRGRRGRRPLRPALPVIVLTGRGADEDRVRGLESGADDYLVKPFHYPELRARIGAVLRRGRDGREGPCRVGEIVIDPARRQVRVGERDVELSNKEFSLLRALASDPTRVFTKEELLRDVWGYRLARAHPDARLARQPAAAQARPRARPLRRQLLGRRLPADRRMRQLSQTAIGWPLSAAMAWRWPLARRCGPAAGAARSTGRCTSCGGPLQALALATAAPSGLGRRRSGSLELAVAALDAARPRDQRRRAGRSAAGPGAAAAGCEAAVGRWRARAGLAGGSIELRWRAGRGGAAGRSRRARPGARQPDRQRDRARRPARSSVEAPRRARPAARSRSPTAAAPRGRVRAARRPPR